jgi:hypothetical protein
LSLDFCNLHRPARGAGPTGATLPDLQLRHLPGAHHRYFYVDGGRSRTFSSKTSWILDGDRWWPLSKIPAAPPRGPVIDVSNFAGRRCWTCRQHLQGPTIDVSIFGGSCWRTCRQHPQGPRHRRLQLQWWPLPDMPAAPLGALLLTSSTSVVGVPGHADSTLQGPAIDVINFGGGRCRTCRQHPLGGHHQRL